MKSRIALTGLLGVSLLFGGVAAARSAGLQRISGSVPEEIRTLGLQPVGRLPGSQIMSLAIGLPLRNQEDLDRFNDDVTNPTSPVFRHYLKAQEFNDAYGPTEQDYQSLIGFARSNGLTVTGTYPNRMLLDVQGTVATIENALHVQMLVYNHPTEGRTFYASDTEPSIDLATPVLDIAGLNNFVLPHPLIRPGIGSGDPAVPQAGSGPGGGYMGRDFRNAYVPGTPLTGTGQKVGLLEFDSGFYQSDITYYENLAGLPHVPVTAVLIDGYNGGPGNGNNECSLDIEMAIAIAPGLDEVRVYEGSVTDDILNAMLADTSVKQFGASWTYPIDGVSNQIWRAMAAQGQSYYNAAGDGDAYVGNAIPTPCDDPYLISVGGTTLSMTTGGAVYTSETVWNWTHRGQNGVGTGGGIGRYTLPTWQQGVDMSHNQGSTTHRDVPDIAMTADNIYVRYANGSNTNLGGTSCATPLWAGFTALVNQQAVANGHPVMGFINPAIYAIGLGDNPMCYFHDTSTGDNVWSQSQTKYYGVAGYDLCTGWGTPTVNLIDGLLGNLNNPCSPADVSTDTPRMVSAPHVLPNPARGPCNITFDRASSGPVRITILDVSGRVVRTLLDGSVSAGAHSVSWDGRNASGMRLADGVYVARVEGRHDATTQKVVILTR